MQQARRLGASGAAHDKATVHRRPLVQRASRARITTRANTVNFTIGKTPGATIAYPIFAGQEPPSSWTLKQASAGPIATTIDGGFKFAVYDQQGTNQVATAVNSNTVDIAGGAFLRFRICINSLSAANESKVDLPGNVILRTSKTSTGRTSTTWATYTATGAFQDLAPANVRAGNGWHDIILAYSPGQVALFEDGVHICTRQAPDLGPTLQPVFKVQVLDPKGCLDLDIASICLVPPSFQAATTTPYDFSFVAGTSQGSTRCTPTNDAFTFTGSDDGIALRITAAPLIQKNSWAFFDWAAPVTVPAEPTLFMNFPLRVNASSGSETKIKLPGDNILRITDDGASISWNRFDAVTGQFVMLKGSGVPVGGSGQFINVSLVVDRAGYFVTVLENGNVLFSREYKEPQSLKPSYAVQHLDAGTGVSVDLGTVRAIPAYFDV